MLLLTSTFWQINTPIYTYKHTHIDWKILRVTLHHRQFCKPKSETKCVYFLLFLYPCETFEKSTWTYTIIMFLFPILTGYIWKIILVYRDSLNIQQRFFWKPNKRKNHQVVIKHKSLQKIIKRETVIVFEKATVGFE